MLLSHGTSYISSPIRTGSDRFSLLFPVVSFLTVPTPGAPKGRPYAPQATFFLLLSWLRQHPSHAIPIRSDPHSFPNPPVPLQPARSGCVGRTVRSRPGRVQRRCWI